MNKWDDLKTVMKMALVLVTMNLDMNELMLIMISIDQVTM